MASVTESLSSLKHDQLINAFEAESALRAEASGTPAHTIGHELEVLRSARPDIPKLQRFDPSRIPRTFYGYTANNKDGVYEVQSSVARHPLAAAVALSGIARLGWLPKGTKGVVTAHISIGTEPQADHSDKQERFIIMLRAMELLGHTTANRLLSPERLADKFIDSGQPSRAAHCGWNGRGVAGVDTRPGRLSALWQGDGQRTEFRTLGYYGPEQFGNALDAAYFLSRGLMAPSQTVAAKQYEHFEDWLKDYFEAHDLPLPPVGTQDSVSQRETIDHIRPYAQHLAEGNLQELRMRAGRTIENLGEEFGMSVAPTRTFFHHVLQRVV